MASKEEAVLTEALNSSGNLRSVDKLLSIPIVGFVLIGVQEPFTILYQIPEIGRGMLCLFSFCVS